MSGWSASRSSRFTLSLHPQSPFYRKLKAMLWKNGQNRFLFSSSSGSVSGGSSSSSSRVVVVLVVVVLNQMMACTQVALLDTNG